jgi:hypothetical protein
MQKETGKRKTRKKEKPEAAAGRSKMLSAGNENEEPSLKGIGLPDRDLKKNLGCG